MCARTSIEEQQSDGFIFSDFLLPKRIGFDFQCGVQQICIIFYVFKRNEIFHCFIFLNLVKVDHQCENYLDKFFIYLLPLYSFQDLISKSSKSKVVNALINALAKRALVTNGMLKSTAVRRIL